MIYLMIIDGKKISSEILSDLRARVGRLGFVPKFVDVLVGADPVSVSYVNIKQKTAESVGIAFRRELLPASASTEEVIAVIQRLNKEPLLCGLIVQLPLPPSLDQKKVLDAISPALDVDCIGSVASAKFYAPGDGGLRLSPPTASGILYTLDRLADEQGIDLFTKHFAVVGQGKLVGKPVSFLLLQRGCTVLVATRATQNLPELIRSADVVISATGQPKLITGSMVSPGAVVIDAGTSEEDGGIVGDVDFESVAPIASYLSPVPGGVGPVTVAKLLENVVIVAEQGIVGNTH